MGANAQIEVPAFTAGQVLTAAEMTQVNTGIPVFATTVTRDAAFGGAGEKVLAEGQFAYIEATNTTQYYDGSAWVAVGVSGSNFITSGSFSGAVSASVNNCFTSTYRNYMIVINASSGSANNSIDLRLRASGTDSTTNYKSVVQYFDCNTAGAFASYARTTSFGMGYMNLGSATDRGQVIATISAPQLAQSTSMNVSSVGIGDGTTVIAAVSAGKHSTETAYDGFTIININGVNIEGIYRVYGLADS
jgi:hypothetical protein